MTFSGGGGVAVAGLPSTAFSFEAAFLRSWATPASSMSSQSSHKFHRSLAARLTTSVLLLEHTATNRLSLNTKARLTPMFLSPALILYLQLMYAEISLTPHKPSTLSPTFLTRTSGKWICKLDKTVSLLPNIWQYSSFSRRLFLSPVLQFPYIPSVAASTFSIISHSTSGAISK